ncbi:serine-rich adhesin for platelets isoform X2 [Drosophila guanche]|uniref:serine-rich adhesin for platelets isoform X2 n=1 Tax=Drosophila guanche TaxID=7266 RepID=UPI001470C221|nr:serine-rich adhesin for platelets isoform X2 [Drosophila guanche]
MQAALMLRSKSRVARRRKLRKLGGRLELPSNVATKEIAPFPRYPPESWKNTYVTTPPAPPPPPPPPPECAQGRAAWLERGRRCSVQDQQQQQATLSRRWVKRNRIQDASLGGSSDDEDFLGVLRGPSTFANAFLYVGLGTVALGLVIAFVGTGEKGFKTVELRLIGPSLIGLGLICCILRILFCICPSHCISSSKKTRKKNGNKIDADHTTSLLRNESKRVSIARGPSVQPKYPIAHKRSQSKMLNEGMEALRQIATTSLFMQNEQKQAINRVVPIINEPDSGDAPLEMTKLQTALSACEMSEEEQEEKARQQRQIAKRTTTTTTTTTTTDTTAVTSSTTKEATIPTKAARGTTLSTVDEKPDSKLVRQRVALQQQRQQPQQQQVKQEQVSKSQSLSSSSTVKDSLDGTVAVEETSLIDATNVATEAVPVSVPASAPAPVPLPSSCSTGAIPRLKTNNSVSFTSSQATRPGISTGATPKTTPTSSRLPTSQSHPTSYDLPPALPHTYSASATVRGPLGMSMSTSTYAMPVSKVGPSAASAYAAMPPTTTTISLLPLPAPPTMATTMASIPGQVPEAGGPTTTTTTTHTASLSLSLMQPTAMRPASASSSSMAMSTSSFSTENKSHPSSASTAASTRGRGSQLLAPPTALTSTSAASTSSKCEPELVLSPAKLGQ